MYPDMRRIRLVHLFHKQILSIETCKQLKDFVIISPCQQFEKKQAILRQYDLDRYLVKVEEWQDRLLEATEVVIYGAGGAAKKHCEKLQKYFNIISFCDTLKKQGAVQ